MSKTTANMRTGNTSRSGMIKGQQHLAGVMAQLVSWVKWLVYRTGSWKLFTNIWCPQQSAAHQQRAL